MDLLLPKVKNCNYIVASRLLAVELPTQYNAMPYAGVCQTIKQPVTKSWLLEVVEKHRWKPTTTIRVGDKRSHEQLSSTPDSDSMPPPKSVPRKN